MTDEIQFHELPANATIIKRTRSGKSEYVMTAERDLYVVYSDGQSMLVRSDCWDPEAIEVYVDEAEEEMRCLVAEFREEMR